MVHNQVSSTLKERVLNIGEIVPKDILRDD